MSDEDVGVRIGNVMYPVDDVESAMRFYEGVFGLRRKFVDGQRFAALDAGGTALALASPDEDLTNGVPAASFKVQDVSTAVQAFVESGGGVVRAPEAGPHEVRAVVRDPWGNLLVVYGPR